MEHIEVTEALDHEYATIDELNKDEEQLHAHSWVELVGEILIGGENADKQYVTIM